MVALPGPAKAELTDRTSKHNKYCCMQQNIDTVLCSLHISYTLYITKMVDIFQTHSVIFSLALSWMKFLYFYSDLSDSCPLPKCQRKDISVKLGRWCFIYWLYVRTFLYFGSHLSEVWCLVIYVELHHWCFTYRLYVLPILYCCATFSVNSVCKNMTRRYAYALYEIVKDKQ